MQYRFNAKCFDLKVFFLFYHPFLFSLACILSKPQLDSCVGHIQTPQLERRVCLVENLPCPGILVDVYNFTQPEINGYKENNVISRFQGSLTPSQKYYIRYNLGSH